MRFFRLMAIGWTLGILMASFVPSTLAVPSVFEWTDKVVHFVLFAGFVGFWLSAFSERRSLRLVLGSGLILALLTEAGQYLLPIGRSAEWLDLLADGLGLLAGYYFDRWLRLPVPNR